MGNRWGGRTMTRRVGRRAVVGTGNPMRTGRYSIWALAAACCACAIVCFSCSPGGGRDSIGVSSFHHDGNTWRFEVAILGRRVSGERSGQVLFAVFYHSSLTMREYGVDLDTRQSWVKLKGSSERPLRIVARPGQHFWVNAKGVVQVFSKGLPSEVYRVLSEKGLPSNILDDARSFDDAKAVLLRAYAHYASGDSTSWPASRP